MFVMQVHDMNSGLSDGNINILDSDQYMGLHNASGLSFIGIPYHSNSYFFIPYNNWMGVQSFITHWTEANIKLSPSETEHWS